MDTYKYLVLLKERDSTSQISEIKNKGQYKTVVFKNGKVFTYKNENIQIISIKRIIEIDDQTIVEVNNKKVNGLSMILDFDVYYKFIFKNKHTTKLHYADSVKIKKNCLTPSNKKCFELFSYFKNVSSSLSLKAKDDYNILLNQYNKIDTLYDDCVLQKYLMSEDNEDIKLTHKKNKRLIYPFGINISQKEAVKNSFYSQVSLIQGPPGTGKTQTILNIIANCIMNDKSVVIASNNNTAIENVITKLKSYDLNFLCALLGSRENKDTFINNQVFNTYPNDLKDWGLGLNEEYSLNKRIDNILHHLDSIMLSQNNLSCLNYEHNQLLKEQQHFLLQSSKELREIDDVSNLDNHLSKLDSSKLSNLKFIYEDYISSSNFKKQIIKIKSYLTYGFFIKPLFLEDNDQVISSFLRETDKTYYEKRLNEINNKRESLKTFLESNDSKTLMNELQEISLKLLKNQLYIKFYKNNINEHKRPIFSSYDLKSKSNQFVKEYPIVLSTTYSIKSSLDSKFIYDYLIIDEASQVDLGTGVIAMSCAKNLVVVGDLKQLPNVLTSDDIKIADKFWNPSFPEYYNFSKESLLSSLSKAFRHAPSTMLKEHYRCDPDIINFCNQRFYDNQLIIMSKRLNEDNEYSSLTLYRTVEGNHARSHFNQREIDVIKDEVLPSLNNMNVDYRNIGIITPYNEQVRHLRDALPSSIEIDTVHKFQGREKDVIIITSVDNDLHGEFSNNENLINVAISRAKYKLVVVTSSNKENKDTIYGDLASYILYNNLEIVDSKVSSVFDMLYKRNFEDRMRYLKNSKRISEYDSENLMYKTIQSILKESDHNNKDVVCHIPLANLVVNYDLFDEEESKYLMCPLTHLDFLIYNKIPKEAIVAIEVDGYSFHKEGSKQARRDILKNQILKKMDIPLIRLNTTGSNEKDIILESLEGC